jgi:Restriction endonuclease NaeI
VHWLHHRAPLQDNALIRLPERELAAIFALPSGQQRVSELFRRAQRMRVSRTVVATVAMQDDYMKRVRGGGGARDQLQAEGIVIFGDYTGDQVLASALGLPRPARASSSAPGWPGRATAAATPVPSAWPARTGGSLLPPAHLSLRPRCPGENGHPKEQSPGMTPENPAELPLVIATGKKKGQHPSPATVMRMLREHDEKTAAAVAAG